MAKSGEAIAKKWADNLSASGESIRAGVMGMTVNPAEKAAAAADRAVANYAKSKDKMVAGLRRTNLSDIQQAMIKKGIPRITDGASTAQPKMAQFMNQLMPHIESAVAALPARGTDAQNEQRMLQFSRAMKKFKRS